MTTANLYQQRPDGAVKAETPLHHADLPSQVGKGRADAGVTLREKKLLGHLTVRGDAANPAPSGDFKVFPGDTLVVAGSPEKVAKAFAWYRTGELRHRSPVDAPPGS